MKARTRLIACFAAIVLWSSPGLTQTPDRRGELATESSTYHGIRANAPIPTTFHIRNEGGSDGAGLCVIAASVINGGYQGVGDLSNLKASRLWLAAKQERGGYGPEKLERLIDRLYPDDPSMTYAAYTGTDPEILDRLSNLGYPIGATMNTGQLYGYAPIHHMISLTHYKTGGYACVVDNNDPGRYHWMPANEFHRRWIDGGQGWAFIWTKLKPTGGPILAYLILGAAVAIFATGLCRRHAGDDGVATP